jgi:surface antigen
VSRAADVVSTRGLPWRRVALGLGLAVLLPASNPAADHDRGSAGAMSYNGLAAPDVALAEQTVQQTLETAPSNTTLYWNRVVSQASGAVTPIRTFRVRGGYFCREYRETVLIGSRVASSRTAVACRDRDGVWKAAGR